VNNKKSPLILVDGSSYLFRAYHALPPLTNASGLQTGAIYGVINMLKRLVKDYQPEHVAVIFDPKGKNFRHDLFPEYKANRAAMPEELREQILPLFSLIKALGFPLVIQDGVEADDVIGTLSQQAAERGQDVLISSGDKDMTQLVNQHITIVNTMTNKTLDMDGVQEKFGVPPERIIDYLALMGDAVDNIPGIPKVGPKTAAKWLAEYGSLDGVVAHADEIKGKVGENLRQHLEGLPLSKALVTIKCDVELDCTLKDLTPGLPDQSALISLFTELEFKKWLSECRQSSSPPDPRVNKHYDLILTAEDFEPWLNKLKKADYFSLDTETTGLDAMAAELVGLSFSVAANEAAYVPFTHQYLGAPTQLDREWVLQQLKPLLEDPKKTIVGQNLKYDYKILANAGIVIQAVMWDTLLASYVVDTTGSRHDLDTLALKYLQHETIKYTDVAGKGAKQKTFNEVSLDIAGPYAAEDADIALQLHEKLAVIYQKAPYFEKVLTEIEWPLMPILADMEFYGVLIDADLLKQQSKSLDQRIKQLQDKIYELAGESFNVDSTKQLREVLFDRLKIPVLKKTPKGHPSTSEEVLQELSLDYPIPQLIIEYRSYRKLKTTYTDKLPEQINPNTGRIHTSYIQTATSTGRLASRDPNLQNIPIRTEEGRKIRQAFIAPKGYIILAADYSQVELRIMAHLSQDAGLIAAFEQGVDVHAATAAEVAGIAVDQVSADQRRSAKAVNFGLMYGMSSFGLAKQLAIGRKEAQAYIDCYFARYPGVKTYIDTARQAAVDQGYVETLLGRRLYMPEIQSKNAMQRKAAERAAINAPLQGSAADIIKLAMIDVDQWLKRSKIDVKMIMQVHDELVFEVAKEVLEKASNQIRDCMEGATKLAVPLTVDIGFGDHWDEAH
jgi:DNA polymerase I